MENELEQALKDKFFCPARFAQEIEGLVHTHGDMNYIDAIVYFCELNAIDLESSNPISLIAAQPLNKLLINSININFFILVLD